LSREIHEQAAIKKKILEENNKFLAKEKLKTENLIRETENNVYEQSERISELLKKITNEEEEKSRAEESNRVIQINLSENKEKYTRDLFPTQEKDEKIAKLNSEFSELKQKFSEESRSQQKRIFTQGSKFETLSLEKINVEKKTWNY